MSLQITVDQVCSLAAACTYALVTNQAAETDALEALEGDADRFKWHAWCSSILPPVAVVKLRIEALRSLADVIMMQTAPQAGTIRSPGGLHAMHAATAATLSVQVRRCSVRP